MLETPLVCILSLRFFVDKLACEPVELSAIGVGIALILLVPTAFAVAHETHLCGHHGAWEVDVKANTFG
jgi:hypothetical protein